MDDRTAVESVLHALVDAAGRGDADMIDSLITEDLLLYKVGHVRGREDMLAAVRDFARRGGSAEYRFSDIVTRVDGDLATMTFRTSVTILEPGAAPRQACWLESAVLTRGDSWRIAFYHSTDDFTPEAQGV
jgi:ketosteroid isomerase-like protein